MSHLVSVNLPIRFLCCRVPAKWRIEPAEAQNEDQLFSAALTYSLVSNYDAWEKRNEFFRLREGDNEGLLNFLNSIGVWDRPNPGDPTDSDFDDDPHEFTQEGGRFVVQGQPERFSEDFWHMREHAQIALSSKSTSDVLSNFDLTTRLVFNRTRSYFLICTITFLEALFATVLIDHAEGARVLKCARPDCGIVFSTDNQHKRKYCCWDCGHLVAVRKSRLMKQHKS